MGIIIIEDKCKGCKICEKACPLGAITMVNRKAVVDNDTCNGCGACLDICKFEALFSDAEPEEKEVVDLSAYKGVWVICEQRDGVLMPTTLELLSEGRRLANESGTDLSAVLLGQDLDKFCDELAAYGADTIYLADDARLATYTTDAYTKVIVDLVNDKKPEIVLVGATNIGRDLCPRVAARLQTGLVADCTRLDVRIDTYMEFAKKETTLDISTLDAESKDLTLKATRPAFGGNLMATILNPDHRPQMATVRPGVMKKSAPDYSRKAVIEKVAVNVT